MMWERRQARISGVYMSKTAALCVLRYLVKVSRTAGSASRPIALRPFSIMPQPPVGMIARRNGLSVCRPTITSLSRSM